MSGKRDQTATGSRVFSMHYFYSRRNPPDLVLTFFHILVHWSLHLLCSFIMIQAGGYIDSTLGVKFGLATLTAAAMGQVVSDVR